MPFSGDNHSFLSGPVLNMSMMPPRKEAGSIRSNPTLEYNLRAAEVETEVGEER